MIPVIFFAVPIIAATAGRGRGRGGGVCVFPFFDFAGLRLFIPCVFIDVVKLLALRFFYYHLL